jgi:hypothetical protein
MQQPSRLFGISLHSIISGISSCADPSKDSTMYPCESEIRLDSIFKKTTLDEREGLSVEDHTFLSIVSSGFQKQDDGHWKAPLPFKPNVHCLR